jgi:hypothetical protein
MALTATLPVAHAHPSKSFFIDMLTKDIPLSVCILDLIDNSIHSLITETNLDVSENLFFGTAATRVKALIEIECTPKRFQISDNCGGISIEDARNRTFLLGSSSGEKGHSGLGVYGIGMKRAFFKIGRQIAFESHTREEDLRIDIDVNIWSTSREWEFPFSDARKKSSPSGGTRIEITSLNDGVSQQFESKEFKATLIDRIGRAYALFIRAGLKIQVNGIAASAEIPDLAASKDLQPVRQLTKKDGVDILIMAGLSPKDDRTPRGWYVFCNGRLILDADRSERTGWGTDSHPAFHSKYNHFLGFVYFRSKDLRKLPWTTTKDEADRDSIIYLAALAQMRVLSRPILDFLNDLYGDVREESEPETNVFKSGKAIPAQRVAGRPNAVWKVTYKKQAEDELVSIQFKRSKSKLKKVKDALGKMNMSASRIGEYAFDWFYERNCK